ncbi:hypothetical protein MTQ01_00475 [Streptomyces sp. XM4193]|uniref:hypothetical protein n=1 Tax=Streptomyces sp. XM4193 TaxID=2929782 RepID=UPI001FF8357F|nr:hypothetical protein [Streptomyces sp. XM4193]MCK1794527.1 hypothetical protein [Streptomyces sp. XM4193]
MSFKVEPEDLDGYARMLSRAEKDLLAGNTHVDKKANLSTSGAASTIWSQVVEIHSTNTTDAKALFNGFEQVLGSSSDELIRSAQYYRQTDEQQAANVDATYPGGRGAPSGGAAVGGGAFAGLGGLNLPGTGFTDRSNPTDSLESDPAQSGWKDRWDGLAGDRIDGVFNNDNGALGGLGEAVGVVLDFTSPSVLINEGLKLAFNFDLFDMVANWIAGDWDSFEQCATTWRQLGDLCKAVAENIAFGNSLLSNSWTGQSAAQAYDYFNTAAQKLDSAQETFNALCTCYEEIGRQINAFVNMVKACMSTILDLALIAALEAAAGAAAGFTGVGLVVTAAAAASIALKIAKMVQLADQMATGLTGVYLAIQAAQASGQAATAAKLADVKSFPKPGSSYDHQAV